MSKPRPYPRGTGVRCPPLPVPPRAAPSPLRWPTVVGGAALTGLLLTLVALTAWVRAHPATAKPNRPAAVQPAAPEVARQGLPAPSDIAQLPLVQEPLAAAQPAPAGPDVEAAVKPGPEAVAAFIAPKNDPPAAAEPAALDCQKFGTAVDFLSNPADAARQADKAKKLLFVLHISGNFECDRFT